MIIIVFRNFYLVLGQVVNVHIQLFGDFLFTFIFINLCVRVCVRVHMGVYVLILYLLISLCLLSDCYHIGNPQFILTLVLHMEYYMSNFPTLIFFFYIKDQYGIRSKLLINSTILSSLPSTIYLF